MVIKWPEYKDFRREILGMGAPSKKIEGDHVLDIQVR